VPTTVLEELDKLKVKGKVNKDSLKTAVRSINEAFLNRFSKMEDGKEGLLPNGFDAKKADCLILSVALKYMKEDKNAILLTSDGLLRAKALGLGVTTLSLSDFLAERRP